MADFTESKPWRDVRSVHGMTHHSGKYACATTGGQPCRLAARVGDRVQHHVPDFLLVMCSGTVRVVNVKPADRLQDPEVV
ncbi:hypothetical protein M878_42815 [Streptomyces roseochromogenus subsp. oscitans DS 12.976]|uniref:Uncharacterized protein n=1 Tax=Streptomyces roseochromogenus subsp. oscitans DS 12.976 TaxID=1352936 RepID=V6JGM1_STRRC|nr:hypothetical protein M878_42815 [Streptomyces roseochromogenus subsp. oscitans DS 12.976]